MPKPNEALEDELVNVINKHIKERGLSPQTAASTLNKMSLDCLEYLAWKPQSVQCAVIYLKEAKPWLEAGCGRPVLSHQHKNGDRELLESLTSDVIATNGRIN